MANEVSSHVCLVLVQLLQRKGHRADALLRGLPISLEHLQTPRSRVSWSTCIELLNRAETLLGSRGLLEEAGRGHVLQPVLGWFPAVARTVISPRELYWLGATLYGQTVFRNVTCRFEDLAPGLIRETLMISSSSADSPQFFQMMLGVLRCGPRLLGLSDARVEMERSPRCASYTIHLPRSLTLRARFLRRIRSPTPALREVIDEMSHQHRDLHSAYRELSDTHATLQAEIAERERAESQLRQAQKLEAVGRLAAGIAHDFNNLLTVINGYAEIALNALDAEHPTRDDLANIKTATHRATEVTSKLLAFSRDQVLKPAVLNLNRVIVDIEGVLRRLIEDQVEVVTRLAPDLCNVMADRTQIEQVILNLALNARDAMPDGGKVCIETGNVHVGTPAPHAVPELQAGDYVTVSLSDAGCGMSEEVLERMFEPFYTTKQLGSGLGLSIVYGIVQQSDGHIAVSSEQDVGTTIRIYFPLVDEPAAPADALLQRPRPGSGTETVLLVEDDELVRGLTRRALEESGYEVVEAGHGEEASELTAAYPGRIDLLVTDVRMPRMGGSELARQLRVLNPDLPVLYVSGYSEDAVLDSLGRDSDFLRKPFSLDAFRQKVRDLLDTAGR